LSEKGKQLYAELKWRFEEKKDSEASANDQSTHDLSVEQLDDQVK